MLAPVRRVQRRLNAMAWAEAGIAPLWAAATVCVAARLLVRGATPWALPVCLAAGGVAWWLRARGRRVSFQHAAVLADRSAEAGGLLLTRLERPAGEWELAVNQLAQAVKPPRLPWQRPAAALAGAVLFLVAGLLLPLPPLTVRPPNAAATSLVTAVQAKAEALAQEEPLGAPLEDELRRLAEEAAGGRFDAADWEAVDGVEQRLAERAAEAGAELAGAAEAARELEEALGAAGGAESAALEREQLERALMALGQGSAAPGAEAGGEQGEDAQARASAQAAAGGNLDQVSDLRQTLERRQEQLARQFGQGSAGKPGQGTGQRAGASQKGASPGEGQGEGEGQSGQAGHASRSVQKGTGTGVGRGGESQPLVFGDEAQMDPDRLKFQPLPPGQGGEAGELWGLRAAEPRKDGVPVPPSAVRGTGAPGEAAPGHSTAPLLPRNRDLVKRYFGGE
ncbi:hypothetical protein [Stigmatella erecta]|uniref:hypothetical protein n=1 Tax=Stigmatella erecta TaxID=83460 RepID=UPI001FEB44FE|nr:hypothetical protein [Stigmatella erecta]